MELYKKKKESRMINGAVPPLRFIASDRLSRRPLRLALRVGAPRRDLTRPRCIGSGLGRARTRAHRARRIKGCIKRFPSELRTAACLTVSLTEKGTCMRERQTRPQMFAFHGFTQARTCVAGKFTHRRTERFRWWVYLFKFCVS